MLQYMTDGGPFMWVIFSVSVLAGIIALERFVVLYLFSFLPANSLIDTVIERVEEKDYAQALEVCARKTWHPLPAVLRAGLGKANRRDIEIEKAMEAVMLRGLPGLQRGVSFLGLLGNVATLIGLLGTISGLIQAFASVSAASASERQAALADGISIAMYTTAFGIIVAVPILASHTLISSRMEKILIQMEEGATALLGALANKGPSRRNVS